MAGADLNPNSGAKASVADCAGSDQVIPHGLVGFRNFKRHNPFSDRFGVRKFHHIEFFCGDASNTWRRFSWGLGMPLVAKSDLTTGNHRYCSYVLRSHNLVFVFTAPFSTALPPPSNAPSREPLPYFDQSNALSFFQAHGLAARAVAIEVDDAFAAYGASVANGAVSVQPPTEVSGNVTGSKAVLAEVKLYGDVVLRYISFPQAFSGTFLPNYEPASNDVHSFGLQRLDHAVGNVPNLLDVVRYIARFTGFHEFAEFTAEDVGTDDSGLNSMVLASNNEMVLLPINEPTFRTRRKSQIQTYLEHNAGPGLQHLALMTSDIFSTLRQMRERSELGGIGFMPRPLPEYYRKVPSRISEGTLSEEQLKECEELGILIDQDDQGTLLQIFTLPVGDRPTIFLEIIQRIGCMYPDTNRQMQQKGGCGGFGKGNFSELFKSIEDYERRLEGPTLAKNS
eukprot:TRINITY_DN8479_c0_g1_i1.p1 TRINITY_DN8479_c0_g1~~TRINITY_DN8479_c0_g1_i1.p1  ORF type:complete len:452 (+),score=94.12 TRINITY_DN8479_c0_g1_i1:133-1488(+)